MPPHPPVWPVLRQPVVRWFFASAFFHVLAHMAVYVFFSLYLDALGYAKSTIGILWAVSVVVEHGGGGSLAAGGLGMAGGAAIIAGVGGAAGAGAASGRW